MYLEMKRNAIEKAKGGVKVGDIFSLKDIVLLTTNEKQDNFFDKHIEDLLWKCEIREETAKFYIDRFSQNYGIEKLEKVDRDTYKVVKVKGGLLKALEKAEENKQITEDEITSKSYTLEQLFVLECKMRGLRVFNYDDLLSNFRQIDYYYDIYVDKKGKYHLKNKE